MKLLLSSLMGTQPLSPAYLDVQAELQQERGLSWRHKQQRDRERQKRRAAQAQVAALHQELQAAKAELAVPHGQQGAHESGAQIV
jgi:hypothetical protein